MRTKTVRRTIFKTKCEGSKYNRQTNEMEDFSCEFDGQYDVKSATFRARREFKDETICIYYVEKEKHYYKMSQDDFIKYAERIY